MSFAELDLMLATPVAMILGARSPTGLPTCGRVVGLRPCSDGALVDIFVSRDQWPQATAGLNPGAIVAVTLSRPTDYHTIQIKGGVEAQAPADAADYAFAEAYRERFCAALEALAVPPSSVSPYLSTRGLTRVRLRPRAIFNQTPGPRAGEQVGP